MPRYKQVNVMAEEDLYKWLERRAKLHDKKRAVATQARFELRRRAGLPLVPYISPEDEQPPNGERPAKQRSRQTVAV